MDTDEQKQLEVLYTYALKSCPSHSTGRTTAEVHVAYDTLKKALAERAAFKQRLDEQAEEATAAAVMVAEVGP
jgi:hypothetical protein